MTNQNENAQKIPMSKSKKFFIIAGIIYFIVLVMVFLYFNMGGSQHLDVQTFCYDNKGIFTESQVDEINETCREIQVKNKLAIFVITCDRDWYGAEIDGDDFLNNYNFSMSDNIAAIIINASTPTSNYHFDIYTYGDALRKVKDKEVDAILYSEGGDLILNSNNSDACEGVIKCSKLLGTAYSWVLPTHSWLMISLIAFAISTIASLIIILSIKRSYTRKRANPTYSFANNSKLNLKLKEDQYIRSVTTSRRIETHTSSGGFSGGHSSGGGGGSGHRGGR